MTDFIDFNSLFNSLEFTIMLRLFLSLILGGSIGLEREYHERPAGFRTHILVTVSATLIMLVSIYGFDKADPARLAAQVIPGIGFIGAGAIMRDGGDIKGITTAATLFVSTMIGLAVGNGFYFGAILTTIISIVSLTYFRTIESRLGKKRPRVLLICDAKKQILRPVLTVFEKYGIEFRADENKLIVYEGTECIRFTATILNRPSFESLSIALDEVRAEITPFVIKILNMNRTKKD